jgi:hypothetical protein
VLDERDLDDLARKAASPVSRLAVARDPVTGVGLAAGGAASSSGMLRVDSLLILTMRS